MLKSCVIALLFSLSIVGCASGSQTNSLQPGMQPDHVRVVLGEPPQTQLVADKWRETYRLHQALKGFVPSYLVFDPQTHQLPAWYADEAEYTRQQRLWLTAFPPPQNAHGTMQRY
jgi:hypothetical protein